MNYVIFQYDNGHSILTNSKIILWRFF